MIFIETAQVRQLYIKETQHRLIEVYRTQTGFKQVRKQLKVFTIKGGKHKKGGRHNGVKRQIMCIN